MYPMQNESRPDAGRSQVRTWGGARCTAKRRLGLPLASATAVLLSAGLAAGPSHAQQSSPWVSGAPLNALRQEHAVVRLPDGGALALGGIGPAPFFAVLDSVERFDPRTNRWTPVAPLPVGLHHTTATLCQGRVIVAGGWEDIGFRRLTQRSFAFDPELERWSEIAPLPVPAGSPAGASDGERVFVFGGNVQRADLQIYDCAANAWSRGPDAPQGLGKQHSGAAVVGGVLVVPGGRTALGAGVGNVDSTLRFDIAGGRWSVGRAQPSARGGIAVEALGSGCVISVGGEGNASNAASGTFPNVEVYDVDADRWLRVTDIPLPVHGVVGGALLAQDRFLVAGGGPRQNASTTTEVQIFESRREPELMDACF